MNQGTPMPDLIANSLPASIGVGFKSQHFNDILSSPHPVGWLEIHAENYLAKAGAQSLNCNIYGLSCQSRCMQLVYQ